MNAGELSPKSSLGQSHEIFPRCLIVLQVIRVADVFSRFFFNSIPFTHPF